MKFQEFAMAAILLISGICTCATSAEVRTIYVDANNISGPWDGSSQHPFKFIYDAVGRPPVSPETVLVRPLIGASKDTNNIVVVVRPGLYKENIRITKNIKLIGDCDDVNSTIIDGNNIDSVVKIADANVSIEGFTITKGYGIVGGGIQCANSVCQIRRCNIKSNVTYEAWWEDFPNKPILRYCPGPDGGGVYGINSDVVIKNCIIQGNRTGYSGRGGFGGGICIWYGSILLQDSQIIANSASLNGWGYHSHEEWPDIEYFCRGDGWGGGVFCYGNLTVLNCLIKENIAGREYDPREFAYDFSDAGNGGGVCCGGNAKIANCVITANKAGDGEQLASSAWPGGLGGGIYCMMDSNVCLINSAITDNQTGRGGSGEATSNKGGDGGGICSRGQILDIHGCTIAGNIAGNGGDAGGYERWYHVEYYGKDGGNGGAIAILSKDTMAIIRNCVLAGNKSGDAGNSEYVCYDMDYPVDRRNSGGNGGDGAAVYSLSEMTLIANCTIANNITGDGASSRGQNGQEGYCRPGRRGFGAVAGWGELSNCIVWDNNCVADVDSNCVANYSDVQTDFAGTGNISIDPLFVKPGLWENGMYFDGDYHLMPESPCINTGDPNYTGDPNEADLDGRPRVIGGRIDMGAYEASAMGLLGKLRQEINSMNAAKDVCNNLGAKLDTAFTKLENRNANNDGTAVNALQAFINTVKAQRGKKIPQEEADRLSRAAEIIIGLI